MMILNGAAQDMNNKAKIKRQFETLAAKIVELPHGGPLMVGIDGITASGKTTFADTLAQMIGELDRPVVRTTIDGFHHPPETRYQQGKESPEGYYADSFDYDTLVKTLLSPLSNLGDEKLDLPTATYDFRTQREVPDSHASFDAGTILLFDGVMLFREEINRYWDYRIYVDARYQTGFIRGVPRDSKSEEDQMVVGQKYLNRYFPGQRYYQATAKPLDQADVILFNDDPAACVVKYQKR
jgi:uridine kinase